MMKGNRKFKSYIQLMCIFLTISFLNSCSKPVSYKIFSNEYFTFNYPKEWFVSSSENVITVTGPIEDVYFVNAKFAFDPEANTSLDEFKKTVEKNNPLSALPGGYIDGGEKELTISGLPAIRHSLKTFVKPVETAPNIALFVNLIYIVSKDQKIGVVITTEVPERFSLKYEESFDSIINSFRFKQ